jgi:hypothetical protein
MPRQTPARPAASPRQPHPCLLYLLPTALADCVRALATAAAWVRASSQPDKLSHSDRAGLRPYLRPAPNTICPPSPTIFHSWSRRSLAPRSSSMSHQHRPSFTGAPPHRRRHRQAPISVSKRSELSLLPLPIAAHPLAFPRRAGPPSEPDDHHTTASLRSTLAHR